MQSLIWVTILAGANRTSAFASLVHRLWSQVGAEVFASSPFPPPFDPPSFSSCPSPHLCLCLPVGPLASCCLTPVSSSCPGSRGCRGAWLRTVPTTARRSTSSEGSPNSREADEQQKIRKVGRLPSTPLTLPTNCPCPLPADRERQRPRRILREPLRDGLVSSSPVCPLHSMRL